MKTLKIGRRDLHLKHTTSTPYTYRNTDQVPAGEDGGDEDDDDEDDGDFQGGGFAQKSSESSKEFLACSALLS
jgi:hypothetical protein